jgi:uracil-DNA glycosylase family 4
MPISIKGPTDAEVMFIGTRPGRSEAKQRSVFVGPACTPFLSNLRKQGFPISRFAFTNCIKCFFDPVPTELQKIAILCEKWTRQEILLRVKTLRLIVTLGVLPYQWLFQTSDSVPYGTVEDFELNCRFNFGLKESRCIQVIKLPQVARILWKDIKEPQLYKRDLGTLLKTLKSIGADNEPTTRE